MACTIITEKRRELIARLLLRGYTRNEIKLAIERACQEKPDVYGRPVGLEQIRRDIEAIRAQLREQIKTKTAEEVLLRFIFHHNEVVKELWKQYDRVDKPETKAWILTQISATIDRDANRISMLFGLRELPQFQNILIAGNQNVTLEQIRQIYMGLHEGHRDNSSDTIQNRQQTNETSVISEGNSRNNSKKETQ